MAELVLGVVAIVSVILWVRLSRLGGRVESLRYQVDVLLRRLHEREQAGEEAPKPAPTPMTPVADPIQEAPTPVEEPDAPRTVPPPLPTKKPVPTRSAPLDIRDEAAPADVGRSSGEELDAFASEARTAPDASMPEPSEPSTARNELDWTSVLLAKVRAQMGKIGPKDPDMGWEMALGTYWLPRLGVAALAVFVVYLLTLAVQKFGPPPPEVRVAAAYAVCGALLGFGWRLEGKYPGYARVLYGGGFATSYFVTFATHYVPIAKIFDTPTITLIGLVMVVLAWGAVAQRRQSPTVAVLTTAIGHLTIGLTTTSVTDPTMFTVAGIVGLSAGSAFFLLRNRWYYVAALGVVGSYANHFLLMARAESSGTVAEFSVGMAVLLLYLLLFALAELFAPEEVRRKAVPVWFRSGLVALNTAAFFILGTILVDGFSFAEGYQYLFRYSLAAALLIIAFAYLLRRKADPLYNVYMVKGIAMLTFGLSAQFSGSALTAWLAVQMVVLLVHARNSGLLVVRLLAFGVGAVTFLQGAYFIGAVVPVAYSAVNYAAFAIQSCLVVVGLLAASLVYQRTDWAPRSPRTGPFGHATLRALWQLDIVGESPDGLSATDKPLKGLLFTYMYAIGAVLLFMGYAARLITLEDRVVFSSGSALVLGGLAIWLIAAPFGRGSVLVLASGFIWAVVGFFKHGVVSYGDPLYASFAVKAAIGVAFILVVCEGARRVMRSSDFELAGVFPGLGFLALNDSIVQAKFTFGRPDGKHEPFLPYLIALAGAGIFLAYSVEFVEAGHRLSAIALASAVMLVLAWIVSALPFGLISLLMVIAAIPAGSFEIINTIEPRFVVISLAALALTAVSSERGLVGHRPLLAFHQFPKSPYALYGVFTWLMGLFLTFEFTAPTDALTLTAAAIVLAGLAIVLDAGAMAVCSTALLIWAQLHWHENGPGSGEAWRHQVAWLLAAVAVAGDRYYAIRKVRAIGAVLLASAWVLALRYVYAEAGADHGWVSFFWTMTGLAFSVYGIGLRNVTAGVLGFVSVVLASLHQVSMSYVVGRSELTQGALIAGFVAPALLWFAFERLAVLGPSRVKVEVAVPRVLGGIFVGVGAGMLVIMFERMPSLGQFFLTISWSLLGLALFGVALAFREKWYRYAGLLVLLLAIVHAFYDTRHLEGFPRVAAWGVLGLVLLGLGYGYVRAFSAAQSSRKQSESSGEDLP